MKLSLIALMTVTLLSVTGCGVTAENNRLRSQVDAQQQYIREQDYKIAELQKAKEAGASSFDQAWDWVKTHSFNAWNSETSLDARARAKKCWDDLKASSN